jgi:mannan endo-1,4-beta-mannosidase
VLSLHGQRLYAVIPSPLLRRALGSAVMVAAAAAPLTWVGPAAAAVQLGPESPAATDTKAPTPPKSLVQNAASPWSVTVSWSASSDNVGVAVYVVLKDGAYATHTTELGATVVGLVCGTGYTIGVIAVDAAGNYSWPATAITARTAACDTTPPSAPTGFAKTGSTTSSVSLSWKASTDNTAVAGYLLFRNGRFITYTTSLGATIGGLGCGTTYTFGVSAFDFFGNYSLPLTTLNASTSSCSSSPSPATVYWGAYISGVPFDMTKLAAFESRANKKVSIVHWGSPWMKSSGEFFTFQTSEFERVRNHGAIPFLDWGAYQQGTSGPNQPNWQNSDIYNGRYDAYIRQWATAAKAWGKPFFLRLAWEMNGSWFPWGEGKKNGAIANGNSPGDFVKMWRHVHDIFTAAGVGNVTWVWCPNIQSVSSDYPSLAALYPGSSYVDWTCLDGYNKYSTWLNLQGIFRAVGTSSWLRDSYQQVLDLAPTKPLMIGETASLEAGDGGTRKGEWFKTALLSELPSFLPKVRALVYFNWNMGVSSNSFPIETSSGSTSGFATGIGSSYYAQNSFAGLTASPIPPLR